MLWKLELLLSDSLLFTIGLALVLWILKLVPKNDAGTTVVRRLREGKWSAAVVTTIVALGLRLALLPVYPVPQPAVHDESSYLLQADTFAHGRLTNPTPPMWEHFETFHVNMVPTYQSKYPIGPGLAMAAGQVLFQLTWAGVLAVTVLMCGAIAWALEAFVPPVWALFGGLICTLRFALFSYWINSYWGGSLAALGGALVLGAAARIARDPVHSSRWRWSILMGVGALLLLVTRPFEGVFFCAPVALFLLWSYVKNGGEWLRRPVLAPCIATLAIVMAGISFVAYDNYRVTGDPRIMPYALNEKMYSPAPIFLWQNAPAEVPTYRHAWMANFYEWQHEFYSESRGNQGLARTMDFRHSRAWFYFVGRTLEWPFLIGVVVAAVDRRLRIALWCLLLTIAAYSCSIYFQPHYESPGLVALYTICMGGLHFLWTRRSELLRALAASLLVVSILFAPLESYFNVYSVGMSPQEGFAASRATAVQWLNGVAGKHMVIVSYGKKHDVHRELVTNGADFPTLKILWARSMGAERDAELCQAYPDRKFWRLVTNDKSTILEPSTICGKR